MIKDILINAGFVENKTFRPVRFKTPPKTTYAVYMDSFECYGADSCNLIKNHDYTIEMYSSKLDPEAEARIEKVFNDLGIPYEKDDAFWIQEEQLFQTVYTFNYIEK